jgi:hypothetical protein
MSQLAATACSTMMALILAAMAQAQPSARTVEQAAHTAPSPSASAPSGPSAAPGVDHGAGGRLDAVNRQLRERLNGLARLRKAADVRAALDHAEQAIVRAELLAREQRRDEARRAQTIAEAALVLAGHRAARHEAASAWAAARARSLRAARRATAARNSLRVAMLERARLQRETAAASANSSTERSP